LKEGPRVLRILVVRPDRIGDVILSTPVFEVIKRHYPNSKLTVMVQEGVAPLIRGIPCVDEVMIYEPSGRHSGFRGFLRLLRDIRVRRFRISVVLQSQFKISFALMIARIRYRVGPLSKVHSFFCFNRGVRQRRSQVEMHETDYNLQLLRKLGIRVGTRNVPTSVAVPAEVKEAACAWLSTQGWKAADPLVVVHPGMGGSALNWPETHYADLIRAMIRDGRQVLVTGGPLDRATVEKILELLGPAREKVMVYGLSEKRSVDFFAGLLDCATVVVAPSTGPLHVAVALKKPVVTFYPPIRVQSAIRWGPYLHDETRASVLTPEVYCGEEFKCKGNLCNYFPCMKTVTVAEAVEQVVSQLGKVQAQAGAKPDSGSGNSSNG
jgi:lipopolysaccharide heptosyltransferase II